MRRLSFFSSPGATPAHHATASRRRHSHDAPGVRRSVSMPHASSMALASPLQTSYDDLAVSSVAFTVVPTGDATGDATGDGAFKVEGVRVSAPSNVGGAQLCARVEERLRAAGALRAGHSIIALRGSDGARVVFAEDVRDGETLAAEVCTTGNCKEEDPAATPAAAAWPAQGDPRWEHNAVSAEAEENGMEEHDAPASAPGKEILFRSTPVMTPSVLQPRQRRRATFESDTKHPVDLS